MLIFVSVFAGSLALVLVLPALSDLWSCMYALFSRRRVETPPTPSPRLLFLVPAHDEEPMIGGCVASLLTQDYPSDWLSVTVLADNCSDGTARVAVEHGANCLERHDLSRPGKPQAIAWALDRLPLNDFDAVAIIDADAVVDQGFARELVAVPNLRSCAVQAFNGVSNPNENALTRLAVLFASARYDFAYPLKVRAGLNVPLQGNGTAMGVEIARTYGWKAFSICEDWEKYAQLTAAGVTTRLARNARVFAKEASTLRQSASQRRRWSGGKITVLLTSLPALLSSRAIGVRQKLDIIAELTAVGPAVHLGFAAIIIAAVLLSGAPAASWIAALAGISVARIAIYSALALSLVPDRLRVIASLTYLPIYIVWRVGIQISALVMVGNKPWVRTQRST